MLAVALLIHYLTTLVETDNLKRQSIKQEKKRNEMNGEYKRKKRAQRKYKFRRRKWMKG